MYYTNSWCHKTLRASKTYFGQTSKFLRVQDVQLLCNWCIISLRMVRGTNSWRIVSPSSFSNTLYRILSTICNFSHGLSKVLTIELGLGSFNLGHTVVSRRRFFTFNMAGSLSSSSCRNSLLHWSSQFDTCLLIRCVCGSSFGLLLTSFTEYFTDCTQLSLLQLFLGFQDRPSAFPWWHHGKVIGFL